MVQGFRVRPGRLLATLLATIAFVVGMSASSALAFDGQLEGVTLEQLFQQLQNTPVYKDACTKTCHGNIAQTKNYSSAIKFEHGYHQLVECSSCHPRFPHRADATIERPTMRQCFDCHGLRHGPMGLVASGKCEDCHVTPKDELRPSSHTTAWAGRAHVAPAEREFNTTCAMCHTPESCVGCHDREGVSWAPEKWEYDAGDGCLACHGDQGLARQSSEGLKSFAVSGLDETAHADLSCQDCHPDYRFDDQRAATRVWTVNAGLACAECHRTAENGKWAASVARYEQSVHYAALTGDEPNYASATCSSCHGGHFIYRLDTQAAKDRLHLSAYRVCARCHSEQYSTYDDYYHGKAYKQGSTDAPACWDCHGSHDILPKTDPKSTVANANVNAACGQKGCHAGADERFGASASRLIHEKVKDQEENPLLRLVARIKGQ